MSNEVQQNPTVKTPRKFKPRFNGVENLYAIYPDYWKKSWGPIPLLGHVRADNEFLAEREAYDRGLLTLNFTFKPRVVQVFYDNRNSNNQQ